MYLGCSLGTVLAMVITGFMTDALGWQSSFYLFGKSKSIASFIHHHHHHHHLFAQSITVTMSNTAKRQYTPTAT